MFTSIDIIVNNFFVINRVDFLNQFFLFITNFGDVWFVLVVSVIVFYFLFRAKNKALLLFFCLNIIVGEILVYLLKFVFATSRPPLATSLVVESSFGFPSGHAFSAIILYFSIYIIMKKLPLKFSSKIRIIFNSILFFLMFLIPLSRMYLGVHWLSDVIGGILLGFLVIFISNKFILNKR